VDIDNYSVVASKPDLEDIHLHRPVAVDVDTDSEGLDSQDYCYIPYHRNALVDATGQLFIPSMSRVREE
jgi:hypothetical protein